MLVGRSGGDGVGEGGGSLFLKTFLLIFIGVLSCSCWYFVFVSFMFVLVSSS